MRIRSWALYLAVLLFMQLVPCAPARQEDISLRGVLIGCDEFVTMAGTAPAAKNNVSLLYEAFMSDGRGYSRLDILAGADVPDAETFMRRIARAAQGAGENDIFLVYIATHGVEYYEDGASHTALVISDGRHEWLLTEELLAQALSGIPGRKVLILDACHAGAFIGKGMSELCTDGTAFTAPEYKVLTSAGGSEDSWYWKTDDAAPDNRSGGSFFAAILASALVASSPADLDRDGKLTLSEVYRYLYEHYAASCPQVYPEYDDTFVLFKPSENSVSRAYVTDVLFESDAVTGNDTTVTFSYTLRESAYVYYQLIYLKNGRWDFSDAQMLSDTELTDDATVPGRKLRSLVLREDGDDASGYVMLLILVRQGDHAVVQSTHLICVQSRDGSNTLSVEVPEKTAFGGGREMNVLVRYENPCSMSVTVVDEAGNTVRRICYQKASRPDAFGGISLWWDGRNERGDRVPDGRYAVKVKTVTGDTVRQETSAYFDAETGIKKEDTP